MGGVGVSVFEVAIGYGQAPGKLRVEVVRSPAGEAAADTGLDAGVLLAGRPHFQQTLLVSGVSARQILTPAERLVRDAGQTLFAALRHPRPHPDPGPSPAGRPAQSRIRTSITILSKNHDKQSISRNVVETGRYIGIRFRMYRSGH